MPLSGGARTRVRPLVLLSVLVLTLSACGDGPPPATIGPAEPEAAAALARAGAQLLHNPLPQADPRGLQGVVLELPVPRPEFTLPDVEGRPFAFHERTRGRLTLLAFGYTYCPDVCPMHLATITGALRALGDDAESVQAVFVTVDPARDTPERLREYLGNFHESIVGLRGTEAEVAALYAAFGWPGPVRLGAGDDYGVSHPLQVLAFTSDDLAHVVYPLATTADGLAADLTVLKKGWNRS